MKQKKELPKFYLAIVHNGNIILKPMPIMDRFFQRISLKNPKLAKKFISKHNDRSVSK